jgi:LysM repeat protein
MDSWDFASFENAVRPLNVFAPLFSVGQMTNRVAFFLLLFAVGLGETGCFLSSQSSADEEREPHFLAGKGRLSAMDYSGAIECFEKALEANPQSASAHFELACLFDQKESDPTEAVYHYTHYLKLRPNAENIDLVRQRMLTCKQELARTVSLGPVNQKVQQELEQLTEDNKRLTEENKRLHEELDKWSAAGRGQPNFTNRGNASLQSNRQTSSTAVTAPSSTSDPSGSTGATRLASTGSASGRTHTVKAGETPTLIARKYGIKLDTLMAANPGLNPKRLQVGQTLSIPGS